MSAIPIGAEADTKALYRFRSDLASSDYASSSATMTKTGARRHGTLGYENSVYVSAGTYVEVACTKATTKIQVDLTFVADSVASGYLVSDWDLSTAADCRFRLYLSSGYLVFEVRSPSGVYHSLTSLSTVEAGREHRVKAVATWTSATANQDYIALVLDGYLDHHAIYTGSGTPWSDNGNDLVLGSVVDGGSVSASASYALAGQVGTFRYTAAAPAVADLSDLELGAEHGRVPFVIGDEKIAMVEVTLSEVIDHDGSTDSAGQDGWEAAVSPPTPMTPIAHQFHKHGLGPAKTVGEFAKHTCPAITGMTMLDGRTISSLTQKGSWSSPSAPTQFAALGSDVFVGTTSPATDYDALQLTFKAYAATKPLIYADSVVYGRLIKPPAVQKATSFIFERLPSAVAGEFAIANHDGLFDLLPGETYPVLHPNLGVWGFHARGKLLSANARFTLLVGSPLVPRGQWSRVFTGGVSLAKSDDAQASFRGYESSFETLRAEFDRQRVNATDYPNAAKSAKGRYLPVVLGKVGRYREGLITDTASRYVTWSDHAISTFGANVYKDLEPVPASMYTTNVTEARIAFVTDWFDEDARYDARPVGTDATKAPAGLMQFVINTYGSGKDSLDAGFTVDDAESTIEVGCYLGPDENTTLEDVLRRVRDSRFVWPFKDGSGVWKSRAVRSDDADALDLVLRSADFISYESAGEQKYLGKRLRGYANTWGGTTADPYIHSSLSRVLTDKTIMRYGITDPKTYYSGGKPTALVTDANVQAWLEDLRELGGEQTLPMVKCRVSMRALRLNLVDRVDPSGRLRKGTPGLLDHYRVKSWKLDPRDWTVELELMPEWVFPVEGE